MVKEGPDGEGKGYGEGKGDGEGKGVRVVGPSSLLSRVLSSPRCVLSLCVSSCVVLTCGGGASSLSVCGASSVGVVVSVCAGSSRVRVLGRCRPGVGHRCRPWMGHRRSWGGRRCLWVLVIRGWGVVVCGVVVLSTWHTQMGRAVSAVWRWLSLLPLVVGSRGLVTWACFCPRTWAVVSVWTTWHVVVTIDVVMGDGIRVVVLSDVAMALWPRSSLLGCCGLSRAVTWRWASGMAMGGRWELAARCCCCWGRGSRVLSGRSRRSLPSPT